MELSPSQRNTRLAFAVYATTTLIVLRLAPHRFAAWYTVTILTLMARRLRDFAAKKWTWFLLDFCYGVNVLCLAYILLSQHANAPALFRVCFALANGPLLVAIAVWGNALIVTSLSALTTVLVHALPPLLVFCLRWYRVIDAGEPALRRALDAQGDISAADIWLNSMGAYLVWQACYILLTEVVHARKLRDDAELLTSLKWLSRDRESLMYRGCHSLTVRAGVRSPNDHFDESQWSTKLTFWGVQFVYTFVTLALVPLMHASQTFHAAVLIAFFMLSVYNGRRSGDVTAGTGPEVTWQ